MKIHGLGRLLNKTANLLLLASMLGASGLAVVAAAKAGYEWWQVGLVVCGILFAWSIFISWIKSVGEKQGLV